MRRDETDAGQATRWWLRPLLDRLLLITVGVALAIGLVVSTYAVLYHRILVHGRWPVAAYEYDSLLGYRLTPGFSGRLLDGSFYARTHRLGYRISRAADGERVLPGGLLAVGGSFVYGDEVEAEQTFAAQAGARLGLPVYNYGVCAYSYASVVLQLRRLKERGVLARLRPSVVVLGLGNWMVPRSLNPFLPSESLQYAYPYLTRRGERIVVEDPPERFSLRHLFTLEAAYFPEGSRDVSLTPGRLWLLAREVPRILYANVLGHRMRRRLSRAYPIPARDVYDFVFREVESVLADVPSQLVGLWMATRPGQEIDPALVQAASQHPRVLLVDGGKALRREKVDSSAYCCGRHPQPAAHEAYALAIVRALSSFSGALRPTIRENPAASGR